MDLHKICDNNPPFNSKVLNPLRKAQSVGQLYQSLQKICHGFGIESFACSEFYRNADESLVRFNLCHTYPEEWISRYLCREYYQHDPVYVNPEITPLLFLE